METEFQIEIRNNRLCILQNGNVIIDILLSFVESVTAYGDTFTIRSSVVGGKIINTEISGGASKFSSKVSEHMMNYSLLQDLHLRVNHINIIPLSDILDVYTLNVKDGVPPTETGINVVIRRKNITSPNIYTFDNDESLIAKDFYEKLYYVFKLWKRMMLKFEHGYHNVSDFEKMLTITAKP